ncbi:hypothetical protein Mapa_014618 [Marchantia paleacea]|nr:hypothetical protein Mapa_014618 [Marchantia paleacea]
MASNLSCGILGLDQAGCVLPSVASGANPRHSGATHLSSLRLILGPLVPTRLPTSSSILTSEFHTEDLVLRAAASFTAFASDSHRKCPATSRIPSSVQALSTETLLPSSPLADVEDEELNLVLESATSGEKLRAAATLRARSFFAYPEGRSTTARKMHQKMKADDECAVLTRKIEGLEQGYKRTACLIATCPSSEVPDSGRDLHEMCSVAGPRTEGYLVVGTLDLNQGLSLPGEVMGECPTGPEADVKRAYLSNVCVAEEVRRRGVGMELVEYAKESAKLWGISYLYVHVVVENISARKLYEKAGFEYEKEESVKEARSLGRPRRYILRTHLI